MAIEIVGGWSVLATVTPPVTVQAHHGLLSETTVAVSNPARRQIVAWWHNGYGTHDWPWPTPSDFRDLRAHVGQNYPGVADEDIVVRVPTVTGSVFGIMVAP